MRKTMLVGVLMTLAVVGCGKGPVKEKGGDTTPPPPASDPKFVSSAGGSNPAIPNQNGNLTVKGGEGVQSPRMAAARTINNAQMKQLHLGIFQTWQLDNAMPGINEIMVDVKQNRQLLPLIQEEVVILTGTKLGNGVWAYSQYPQRNGNHYVVVSEGVVEMSPADLKSRLTQEKSPIKMSQ
jgi:hypothetical protein